LPNEIRHFVECRVRHPTVLSVTSSAPKPIPPNFWPEDRCRHRQPNAALNLALTRNVRLSLILCEPDQPLADFFEQYHHPKRALQLILPLSLMILPAKHPDASAAKKNDAFLFSQIGEYFGSTPDGIIKP
jgi:hypothetical protein